jgi:hypothetical protein
MRSTDFSLTIIYFENVHFYTRATFVGRLIYDSFSHSRIWSGNYSPAIRSDELTNVLIVSVPPIANSVNIFFDKAY